MLYSERIENYVMRIHSKENGSGILVKPCKDSKYYYVFTARHVFLDEEEVENFEYIKYKDSITIHTKDNKKLYHENIILIGEEYDLAIFQLNFDNEKNKEILSKIDVISIFNDEFTECIAMGFPDVKIVGDDLKEKLWRYEFKYHRKYNYFQYEALSKQILFCPECSQTENMQGFSGSGMLVKGYDNQYYLSGIVIKSANQGVIICLDITSLFEKINTHLPLPIQIGGYSYKQALGIENSELDLEKLYELIDKKLPLIQEIEENKNKLEFIETGGTFNKKLKDRTKDLDELPIVYLYQALLFHNSKQHLKATNNFKKAIQYKQDFKAYFYKAKASRKNNKNENKTPDENPKDNLKELEYLINNTKHEQEEKIDYFNYLNKILPIYKEQKDNEKLESTYLALLSIYLKEIENPESKEKTSTTYYELAKLAIAKGEKSDYRQSAELLENALKTSNNEEFKQKIKKILAQTYFYISKENTKENTIKINFLQKAEEQFHNPHSQSIELLGTIHRSLAYCFFKENEWVKTEKSLNKALVVFQKLKHEDNNHIDTIIKIYRNLAINDNKLKQASDINSSVFFKSALDEINFLGKETDTHKKYQHKILEKYKSHIDSINNKQQKLATIIIINEMKDRLKQQGELQKHNNNAINKLQNYFPKSQEKIMIKIEEIQQKNLDKIEIYLSKVQENLQEERKNNIQKIQPNIDKEQKTSEKNEQLLTLLHKIFILLTNKIKQFIKK
jgi:hypothetical protein